VKVVKNKAYFKRFQTKFRRRREGKTDYQARKRLIWVDKNKYSTPKYRLVVRFSNKYCICQVVNAKIIGDETICQATSAELKRYGLATGLTNYAAAYATGLLCGRRLLQKFNLDSTYKGVEAINGEDFTQETIGEKAPFHCVLDVGLVKTTTGANVFGALKGCVDAGVVIPHSNKRFPGSTGKEYKAEVHRDRIMGKHIGDYMEALKEKGDEHLTKQFADYVKAGITDSKGMEKLFKSVHEKIRADPSEVKKEPFKPAIKKHKRQKLNAKQRYDRIKQKKESFLKSIQTQLAE